MSGLDIQEGFRVLSGLEALSIQGMDATLLAKYAASSASLDTDQLFQQRKTVIKQEKTMMAFTPQ